MDVGERTLEIMNQAQNYNTWVFDLICPHLSGCVAEAGAGIGNFTGKLITAGFSVTAIDINASYLKKIQSLYPQAAVCCFDLQSKELSHRFLSSFDSAVILNVLEHIPDHLQVLKNLFQMLKPQGRVVILVPAHSWAYGSLDKSLGHVRRYNADQLQDAVVQAGFQVDSCRHFNFFGLWGWWFNCVFLRREIIPSQQVGLFDFLSPLLLFWEKIISSPVGLSLLCVAQKPTKSQ